MKILNQPQQLNSRIKNQPEQRKTPQQTSPNFTGAEAFTMFLRFLETNQALGASAVDIGCMGIPRTTVDFTRGPDAGFETMRREFSSTADDALIGAFGVGAAYLISQGFNKKYDVKMHKMFVGDEMLDILSHTWAEKANAVKIPKSSGRIINQALDKNNISSEQLKKEQKENLERYLKELVSNTHGFNPEHSEAKRIDNKGWVKVKNGENDLDFEKIINKFAVEIEKGPEQTSKETKLYLKSLIAGSTGAESKIKLTKTINGKQVEAISSLDDYIDNIYNVSKAFMKNNVAETFKNSNASDNLFIKGLKKLNKTTSVIGIGIATAIGCSLQPLNMYLTRKKTGKTGFVGVEGREPDKSSGFKLMKLAIAGAAGVGIMRTIGRTSEILSKVQFRGVIPTIPQFKLVYGMTVVSRFLAARDKNELREATIKDTLGFVNWLILGGFVSKLTAAGLEKMSQFKNDKFIRYNETENGKGFFNWLIKSSLVTRDEILHSGLKKAGISTIKANGKAMTFKEMMEAAPKHLKTKVRYVALIQLAGYAYSGLVLGMGIPKLNIAITNSIEKKRKAKLEAAKKEQPATQAA